MFDFELDAMISSSFCTPGVAERQQSGVHGGCGLEGRGQSRHQIDHWGWSQCGLLLCGAGATVERQMFEQICFDHWFVDDMTGRAAHTSWSSWSFSKMLQGGTFDVVIGESRSAEEGGPQTAWLTVKAVALCSLCCLKGQAVASFLWSSAFWLADAMFWLISLDSAIPGSRKELWLQPEGACAPDPRCKCCSLWTAMAWCPTLTLPSSPKKSTTQTNIAMTSMSIDEWLFHEPWFRHSLKGAPCTSGSGASMALSCLEDGSTTITICQRPMCCSSGGSWGLTPGLVLFLTVWHWRCSKETNMFRNWNRQGSAW